MAVVIAIAAMDESRVIGMNGGLPWSIPEDWRRFKSLTRDHVVVMGRSTFETLPEDTRPLPDRTTIVITRRALEGPRHNARTWVHI